MSGFNYFPGREKNQTNAQIIEANPHSLYMTPAPPSGAHPAALLKKSIMINVPPPPQKQIKSISYRKDVEFNSGIPGIPTWQIEIKQSHLNTQQVSQGFTVPTSGFNQVI